MSDASPFDLRAELARIDRDRAETQKLLAEGAKFLAEMHDKYPAEMRKLRAEAAKLERERWWQPALAIASVIGGMLGAAAFISRLVGWI